ncbi:ABC transporter permease [Bordetella sp. BOR01]|uniref:ABC transporter permease n=1 Tax=Bordetella sp. BOR01 TaxID=2854779 RepID=UPI001C46192C|nr:ABC transporter permease [Bordetella sp. BOR01]MBV7487081.1 ABC transporter permease [Bordetella sp. BOR01]
MKALRWFSILIVAFVTAPMFIVVPMSFSHSQSFEFPPPGYWLGYYEAYFSDPRWTLPTLNSLLIGLGTALLTMMLVVPATFALTRDNFRGKSVLNLLLILPLTVPHIVVALGYYYYFGELGLIQSRLGVILAHTCLSVPVVYLIVSATLKGFDQNLERAAQNLGASPMKAFFLVTFPVLRPGFLAAALFAFVHSFDEAVVSLFISGRDAATLPRQMFDSLRMQADPIISVVSTLILMAMILALAAPRALRCIRSTQRPSKETQTSPLPGGRLENPC